MENVHYRLVRLKFERKVTFFGLVPLHAIHNISLDIRLANSGLKTLRIEMITSNFWGPSPPITLKVLPDKYSRQT